MISVGLCTGRKNPRFQEMADSLYVQIQETGVPVEWVVCDMQLWYMQDRRDQLAEAVRGRFPVQHIEPKPNVWQGPHRLTSKDYWGVSNARNTVFAHVKYDLVALHDDCTIFGPGWLKQLYAAGSSKRVSVAGGYKYFKLGTVVQDGRWVSGEFETPGDHRMLEIPSLAPCPGNYLFGANMFVPLWVILETNGLEELMDGSGGLEDCEFGVRLGRVAPTYFEPLAWSGQLMDTHEAVTEFLGLSAATIRGDHKTETPKRCKGFRFIDHTGLEHWMTLNHVICWWLTGHKIHLNAENIGTAVYDPKMAWHRDRVRAVGNQHNLVDLRKMVQAGKPLPIPTHPTRDWRDKKLLSDDTNW